MKHQNWNSYSNSLISYLDCSLSNSFWWCMKTKSFFFKLPIQILLERTLCDHKAVCWPTNDHISTYAHTLFLMSLFYVLYEKRNHFILFLVTVELLNDHLGFSFVFYSTSHHSMAGYLLTKHEVHTFLILSSAKCYPNIWTSSLSIVVFPVHPFYFLPKSSDQNATKSELKFLTEKKKRAVGSLLTGQTLHSIYL